MWRLCLRRVPIGVDIVAVAKRERIDPELLHRRAQFAVLSGPARGDDVSNLIAAAAPSHVPGWFTPDVALLELAVTALDLACPSGLSWVTEAVVLDPDRADLR